MSNVKERLYGAITVMDEATARKLWEYVRNLYDDQWADIEEVDPDEIDLKMIRDIESDPDCHTIATAEEVQEALGHV